MRQTWTWRTHGDFGRGATAVLRTVLLCNKVLLLLRVVCLQGTGLLCCACNFVC